MLPTSALNDDPMQKCFTIVYHEIEKYVKKTEKLQNSEPGCWEAMKARFKDRNLTAIKLKLGKDLLYTITQIQNDVNKLTRENDKAPPALCARLDHSDEVTAFARLQNCLHTAKTTVEGYNEIRLAGGGELLAALNQAIETYDVCWADYKEKKIWDNQLLWGAVFEHNDAIKATALKSFDAELPLRSARFTAIMTDTSVPNLVRTQSFRQLPHVNTEMVDISLADNSGSSKKAAFTN